MSHTNPARISAFAGGGGGGFVVFCGEGLTAAIDSAMECWSVGVLRDDLNFVPYKVTNPARICAVAGGVYFSAVKA